MSKSSDRIEHLPECPCPTDDDDPWYCCAECDPGVTPPWERACICDLLRACEVRVMTRLSNVYEIEIKRERNEALDAAREAVEDVPDAIFQQAAWVRHTDVLAAIDALREEQK